MHRIHQMYIYICMIVLFGVFFALTFLSLHIRDGKSELCVYLRWHKCKMHACDDEIHEKSLTIRQRFSIYICTITIKCRIECIQRINGNMRIPLANSNSPNKQTSV